MLRFHWINGIVVAGYGVASGNGADTRYPGGTIRLQQPFFLARGIDLSPYFPGTLNVDVAPLAPVPQAPVFDEVLRWHGDIEERFLLSPVELEHHGRRYAGLWYYPHPDTKPAHFQKPTVVELLLPRIERIETGADVKVGLVM
ncbi:hypothetical protein SAMN06265795_107116 [Noviherbaspirillum humi]|uniref:Uncharacterized protein n=1 Tax=Noviherbaspirillum humi TaxID=1688639 RepID=A0A239HQY8_9BURK|nr:hypothetical protein [Noviherbaspirillum humi]SNS83595.1 hypothetical protein SAMN06265795_107116 [Noviherbaspirillum humi]